MLMMGMALTMVKLNNIDLKYDANEMTLISEI